MININDLHTTESGVERIRRNLSLDGSVDVVDFCRKLILEDSTSFECRGKNWYATTGLYKITINAGSNTIITAHKYSIEDV